MNWAAQGALTGLVIAGMTTEVFSATPQESAAPKETAAAAAPSIDGTIGKKLTAIDGSLIVISASEGGLTREIVGANGAVQKTALRFINERLGTVMDTRDTSTVTGVFRIAGAEINIQYADGLSESVLANSAGGISIETKSRSGAAYCAAWYPEGHVFSMDDRKAALAQYAIRLGLPGGEKKIDAGANGGCSTAAPSQTLAAAKPDPAKPDSKLEPQKADTAALDSKAEPQKIDTAKLDSKVESEKADIAKLDSKAEPQKADAAKAAGPALAAAAVTPAASKSLASQQTQIAKTVNTAAPRTTADVAAEIHAIEVRKSEVHLIDGNPAAEAASTVTGAAAAPAAAAAAAATAATAAKAATPIQAATPAPERLASVDPKPSTLPTNQQGASSCLSVESDGSHWGFRNRCEYTVQFSYCLMSASEHAACQNGAVAGSVAGKGFGALVTDDSLKETDVTHDFRWVACRGGAGEVIARLEQTNPPSGRCVR